MKPSIEIFLAEEIQESGEIAVMWTPCIGSS